MKKLLMILIPILLLGGGGAYFAATKGMINIPGITPKKKAATEQYQEPKEPETPPVTTTEPEKEPLPEEKKVPTEDPKLGQAKVAALWNEMDDAALVKLIADWKDEDLAPIFSSMSGEKVTKVLTLIAQKDAMRASRLTKAIQAEASKIEPPKEGED